MKAKKGKVLGIAAAAIVLIAGELFARFGLGLGNPPLSVVHPTIEYMFKPGQDLERFGHRVLVHAYGMRSPDFPEHRNTESSYSAIRC